MRTGEKVPDRLKNAPVILPGLELYFNAFMDLDSCRQLGMGMGPISWGDRQDYARENIFSEEQTRQLHFYVGKMDRAYLKWYSEKKRRETSK